MSGLSTRAIATELTMRAIPTPRGAAWLVAAVEGGDGSTNMDEPASFSKNITGIAHTIFVYNAPYVKVALRPPQSLNPHATATATVALDGRVIGKCDPRLAAHMRLWVQLNRPVLLAYWRYEIATDELQRRLRALP